MATAFHFPSRALSSLLTSFGLSAKSATGMARRRTRPIICFMSAWLADRFFIFVHLITTEMKHQTHHGEKNVQSAEGVFNHGFRGFRGCFLSVPIRDSSVVPLNCICGTWNS